MRSPIPRGRFLVGALTTAASLGLAARSLARGAPSTPALPQTIRVRLFSGAQLSRVDIAGSVPLSVSVGPDVRTVSTLAVDASTWTASGDGASMTVAETPLFVRSSAPISLTAYGGSLGAVAARHYNGWLTLQRVDKTLLVVNTVDVESYVASTLASEISPGWPVESIKAQAIVNRTYGLRAAVHATARAYDVTDGTSNQVYQGLDGVAASFVSAASVTAGISLMASGAPADLFYSSACGGHTASSAQLTGRPGPPYLNGIADVDASGRAYCTAAPFFAWQNSVPNDAMARVVSLGSADLADLIVSERWPDGRAKTLRVVRFAASSIDLDGHQFYARCGAVLGYKVLPSALFEVARTTEGYTFTGHGLGHGVGMCQWGAHGRADAGMTAAQILAAYFPGTSIAVPRS